jgi:hypothetical protein
MLLLFFYVVALFSVHAEARTIAVQDGNTTITPSPSPSPTPTATPTPLNKETNFLQAMLIAAVVTASVFGAGFLIYLGKRRR